MAGPHNRRLSDGFNATIGYITARKQSTPFPIAAATTPVANEIAQ